MFQSVQIDENHFRHRQPFRIRELSPIWLPPPRAIQSLVSVSNNSQSAGNIVRSFLQSA